MSRKVICSMVRALVCLLPVAGLKAETVHGTVGSWEWEGVVTHFYDRWGEIVALTNRTGQSGAFGNVAYNVPTYYSELVYADGIPYVNWPYTNEYMLWRNRAGYVESEIKYVFSGYKAPGSDEYVYSQDLADDSRPVLAAQYMRASNGGVVADIREPFLTWWGWGRLIGSPVGGDQLEALQKLAFHVVVVDSEYQKDDKINVIRKGHKAIFGVKGSIGLSGGTADSRLHVVADETLWIRQIQDSFVDSRIQPPYYKKHVLRDVINVELKQGDSDLYCYFYKLDEELPVGKYEFWVERNSSRSQQEDDFTNNGSWVEFSVTDDFDFTVEPHACDVRDGWLRLRLNVKGMDETSGKNLLDDYAARFNVWRGTGGSDGEDFSKAQLVCSNVPGPFFEDPGFGDVGGSYPVRYWIQRVRPDEAGSSGRPARAPSCWCDTRRRSVISVGLSKYAPNAEGKPWQEEHRHDAEEARLFCSLLERKGSVFNTHLLLNEEATSNGLLSAWRDVREKSLPGDEAFFFMATHGNLGKLGLYEVDSVLTMVRLRDMFPPPDSGVKVVAVLNACHSGSFQESELDPESLSSEQMCIDRSNLAWVSCCRDNEIGHCVDHQSFFGRMFLIEGWQCYGAKLPQVVMYDGSLQSLQHERDGQLTMLEVAVYAEALVCGRSRVSPQHVMHYNDALLARTVLETDVTAPPAGTPPLSPTGLAPTYQEIKKDTPADANEAMRGHVLRFRFDARSDVACYGAEIVNVDNGATENIFIDCPFEGGRFEYLLTPTGVALAKRLYDIKDHRYPIVDEGAIFKVKMKALNRYGWGSFGDSTTADTLSEFQMLLHVLDAAQNQIWIAEMPDAASLRFRLTSVNDDSCDFEFFDGKNRVMARAYVCDNSFQAELAYQGQPLNCSWGADGFSVSLAGRPLAVTEIEIRNCEFATDAVAVDEGGTLDLCVSGGSHDKVSSVQVYLSYGEASAADLDLARGTIDGEMPKGGLKFPLTLSWAKGEVTNRVIRIPVKEDKAEEATEVVWFQLAAASGVEIGDIDVCRLDILNTTLPSAINLAQAVNNPLLKVSTSGAGKWIARDDDTLSRGNCGVYNAVSPELPEGMSSTLALSGMSGKGRLVVEFFFEGDENDTSTFSVYAGKSLMRTFVHSEFGNDLLRHTVKTETKGAHTYSYEFTQGNDSDARAVIVAAYWIPDGASAPVLVFASTSTPDLGYVAGMGHYTLGSTAKLVATHCPGCAFVAWYRWSDDESKYVEYSKSAKLSYVVTEAVELMAKFEPIPYVAGLADPADGGMVTGSGYCATGKKVTLKATANKNFTFVGWYDGEGGVATQPTLVIDRSTKPAKSDAKQFVITNVSESGTYYARFKSDPEVFVTVTATDGKGDALTGKGAGKYVAGTITGAGKYAKDKKVTLKATANKGYVFAGWYEGEGAVATQAGEHVSRLASYVLTMPTNDVAYVAKFVTTDEDKASISAAVNGMDLSGTSGETPLPRCATNVWAGVYLEWPVAASALSATTVKVSGLPSGLKFTAKPVTSKVTSGTGASKVTTVVTNVPANTIYGAPTKASKTAKAKDGAVTVKPSEVKVTVTTAGKNKQVYQIDTTVDPLPSWAVGTFAGPSYVGGRGATALPGDEVVTNGVATVTVAASGKITAKQPVNGKATSFAANYFDFYDAEDDSFWTTLTAKVGKEIVTNGIVVMAAESGMGFIAADRFDAWQHNWKVEPWKVVGKSFDKREHVYVVKADGSFSTSDEDVASPLGTEVIGKVTLKFSAKGTAKVTGEFTDASGKVVKASGSATLLPMVGEDGETRYLVFVYLAPKGLPPHARCVEFEL